jgi:prepilin-type processing-associated H-X9-DG protein
VDMLVDPNCVKLAHKKGINVLYADASVRWIDTQKLIARRGLGLADAPALAWLGIPKPSSPETGLDNVAPAYDDAMLNDAGTMGIWVWLDRQ